MRKNNRRGFSLVEVSTVIGVSTVIAGMAVWLVHASMQKSRDGQKHLATQNAVARLAETWRGDAHAATSISEEKVKKQGDADTAAGSTWILTLASGDVVRYRLEPGRVARSEFAPTTADNKDAAKARSRDCFKLPAGVVVAVQLEPPSEPRIASLLITPPAAESRPASGKPRIHPMRIDAAVSTDVRFEKIAPHNKNTAATSKETKK